MIPRPLRVERQRVQCGPVAISYEVVGVGPPLVLIHGLSGSGRWWSRNVGPLARRFRVHVVDLIGFGESRDGQPFILAEAARYLVHWMDEVGIDRSSIVGHSMGAFVGAELAANYPQRVDRLVLVDAAVWPLADGHQRHAVGLARALRRLPLSFLPVLVADSYRAGPMTLWKAARQLLTADVRPKLAGIQAPTLVVWGQHDALVPLEVGEQLVASLPGAALVVIADAGHNPMWDRPAEFNRVVGDFLAGEIGPGASALRGLTAPRPRPQAG